MSAIRRDLVGLAIALATAGAVAQDVQPSRLQGYSNAPYGNMLSCIGRAGASGRYVRGAGLALTAPIFPVPTPADEAMIGRLVHECDRFMAEFLPYCEKGGNLAGNTNQQELRTRKSCQDMLKVWAFLAVPTEASTPPQPEPATSTKTTTSGVERGYISKADVAAACTKLGSHHPWTVPDSRDPPGMVQDYPRKNWGCH